MKLDYSDLDIVCSDRLLKSDKDLELRVVMQAARLSSDFDKAAHQVWEFYVSYLDEKLESADKKGAHVDFSTLVLSAGRAKHLNFIQVYDALKADYAYCMRRAKKEVVERDMLDWANRTLDLYLTFGEMHKEQVKMFADTIKNYKDWFAEMSFRSLKCDVDSAEAQAKPPLDDFSAKFYKWLDS